MMGSVWYLENGASSRMTDNKELFSNLEEKYLQIHIDMGDNGRYSTITLDTVTF